MAFSCEKDGKRVYSFEYDLPAWIALKEDTESSFTMSCCGRDATLKTSRLGTQFFAHKPDKNKVAECGGASESPEHTHLKYIVSRELYLQGWCVEIEKRGISEDGEAWIADIYAEKGRAKIAIEVQWSPQSYAETKRRHGLYERSGVRCAWLLRSVSKQDVDAIVGDYTYNTKKMPVFSIYKDKQAKSEDGKYKVWSVFSNKFYSDDFSEEYTDWAEVAITKADKYLTPIPLSVSDFIRNLVSSNIVFKRKHADACGVNLSLVRESCWRCKTPVNSVRSINAEYYCYEITANLFTDRIFPSDIDLNQNRRFIDFINTTFSHPYNFEPLRNIYSKTEGCSYLASSCGRCGSLMGKFFLINEYSEEDTTHTHTVYVNDNLNEVQKVVGRWFLVG